MEDHTEKNDPKWRTFQGKFDHAMTSDDGQEFESTVGIGGYKCSCCEQGSVVFALFSGDTQVEVGVSTEEALQIASEIMVAIERAGGLTN